MLMLKSVSIPPGTKIVDAHFSEGIRRIGVLVGSVYFIGLEISLDKNDNVCIVVNASNIIESNNYYEYAQKFPVSTDPQLAEMLYDVLSTIDGALKDFNETVLEILKHELMCHILDFNNIPLEKTLLPPSFSMIILTPITTIIS